MKCDLARQGEEGGYYDGPLAWRLAVDALGLATASLRSKRDCDFYDKARDLQKNHQLPEGHLSTKFKTRGPQGI